MSVEINARPEREDHDEAVWIDPLVDSYEAEVTAVAKGDLVIGGEVVTLTLATGDKLTVTTRGARDMERDYEYYSNRDSHNPRNRVRIAVVADDEDDEDGDELVTDGGTCFGDGGYRRTHPVGAVECSVCDRRARSGSQVTERDCRYDVESERTYLACDACLKRLEGDSA
ncbi:hypothetical protein ACFQS4_20440 [Saliphagus sp. GCM10025317]